MAKASVFETLCWRAPGWGDHWDHWDLFERLRDSFPLRCYSDVFSGSNALSVAIVLTVHRLLHPMCPQALRASVARQETDSENAVQVNGLGTVYLVNAKYNLPGARRLAHWCFAKGHGMGIQLVPMSNGMSFRFQGDPAGNVWMEDLSNIELVKTQALHRPLLKDSKVVLTDKGRTYWGNACPDPKGQLLTRRREIHQLGNENLQECQL